jgi:hypothetical protein
MEYGFQWRLLDGGVGMTVYAWVSAALYHTSTVKALDQAFNDVFAYIDSDNPVPVSGAAINSALAKAKMDAKNSGGSKATAEDFIATSKGVRIKSLKKACTSRSNTRGKTKNVTFYCVDWDNDNQDEQTVK